MSNDRDERDHEGQFLPPSIGEEILDALNHANLKLAAALLRDAPSLPQPYLAALAEMMDGDPKEDPSIPQRASYRLTLATWGLRGRKAKGAKVKGLTPHKRKSKEAPPDAALRWKVRLKLDEDATLTLRAAFAGVANAEGISASLVEKAYYRRRQYRRGQALRRTKGS